MYGIYNSILTLTVIHALYYKTGDSGFLLCQLFSLSPFGDKIDHS